jgi:hypothetical protein
MLLCIVNWVRGPGFRSWSWYEDVVDLAGDVAFQASDDLGFGESFLGSALGVDAASWVVAEAVEHDDVEGVVGVAVAASVESVSVDTAAAGRDRRDTAQMAELGLGGDPVGVVAGAGQELAGDLGADTGKGEQVGRHLAGQLGDLQVGFADFLAQVLVASGESTQGGLGGLCVVAEPVAGTQPGAPGDDLRRR